MRIYVSGMTATGKSTLIDTLHKEGWLEKHGIIPATYEYSSGMLPFLINEDYYNLQRHVFYKMIAQQLLFTQFKEHMLIDRSMIDWLCYTQILMEIGKLQYMQVADLLSGYLDKFGVQEHEIHAIHIDPPVEWVTENITKNEKYAPFPWNTPEGIESLHTEFQDRWDTYSRAHVETITTINREKRIDQAKEIILRWLGYD